MRVNICSVLALLLGCNAISALRQEVVEERTSGSLPCPHSVEGTVTWSRERNGNKVAMFTIVGELEIRYNGWGKRYGLSRDNSLHIRTLTLSDSGRYFCNDEAVELTVIPLGTIRVDATERTSVTLDCPHDDGGSHDPTWSRDSVEIHRQKGFDVPPVDRTLTLADLELRDSGLYYCGRKAVFLQVIEGNKAPPTPAAAIPGSSTTTRPTKTMAGPTTTTTTTMVASTVASKDQQQSLIRMAFYVLLLLILIISIIVYFSRKRRFRKQGNEEIHTIITQADNGESSAEPTTEYCMTDFTDNSNQIDPTYSNIP